jgi:hypothetical protein
MSAGAVASILLLFIIAAVHEKQRGKWAIVRLSALLSAACLVAGTGIFFAVLDNCRLSCGTKLRAESSSPSRRNRAILLSEACTSFARYCPATAHVSVVSEAADSARVERTVFSLDAYEGVEFQWLSEDHLLIRYWALARILRRENRAGAVRIEYLPIPAL